MPQIKPFTRFSFNNEGFDENLARHLWVAQGIHQNTRIVVAQRMLLLAGIGLGLTILTAAWFAVMIALVFWPETNLIILLVIMGSLGLLGFAFYSSKVEQQRNEVLGMVILTITFAPFCAPLMFLYALVCFWPWDRITLQDADGKEGLWDPRRVQNDDRYREYLSLVEYMETWNEFADSLNRIVLKLEHNQIPTELVLRAESGLEAMRANEEMLRSRIGYCTALAKEGKIGTRTARQQLGASLVIDQSHQLAEMRERMNRLREFDERAIAALEVAAIGKR